MSAQNVRDAVRAQIATGADDVIEQILACRPPFAHSLPIQLLLASVLITLLITLTLHLLFTAPHHRRLAPLNFALQLAAAVMLTVAHVSELVAIMRSVTSMSKSWPYMLNYVAVQVPPGLVGGYESPHVDPFNGPWSRGTLIAWCSMRALTSILIQMTHIQFLTILYPSTFVSRLIVGVLSPLALISACTQYVPLSTTLPSPSDPGPYKALVANLALPSLPYLPLPTLALVTRQTLNTTLSLLFTILFLFWGTYLHPRRAWRAEGGTAAFGIGAVGLAALGASLGFVCLPGVSLESPSAGVNQSPCSWLPGLVWVVILWQSYLGWWWWVGSGVGFDRKRRRRRAKEELEMEDSEGEVLWQTTAMDGGGGGARRRTRRPERDGVEQKESARKRGWLAPYIPFNKLLRRRQSCALCCCPASAWRDRVDELRQETLPSTTTTHSALESCQITGFRSNAAPNLTESRPYTHRCPAIGFGSLWPIAPGPLLDLRRVLYDIPSHEHRLRRIYARVRVALPYLLDTLYDMPVEGLY